MMKNKGILWNKHGWIIEYTTYGGPGKESIRSVDLIDSDKSDPRLLELEGKEVSFYHLKINPLGRQVDPFDLTQNQSGCKWVARIEFSEPLPVIDEQVKNKKSREYILCAAIWYKDITLKKEIPQVLPKNCDRGLVVLGHRHGQAMWTMSCLTGLRSVENAEDGVGEHEQGFLTNTNRFVGREEALEIAIREDQVMDRNEIRGDRLFSEDLY